MDLVPHTVHRAIPWSCITEITSPIILGCQLQEMILSGLMFTRSQTSQGIRIWFFIGLNYGVTHQFNVRGITYAEDPLTAHRRQAHSELDIHETYQIGHLAVNW